jgi:hypothetical protein
MEVHPAPTASAVASLTDEGRFELLAMAILREADPIYRLVAHTGINAAGRTVKCPVDAIGFVRGSDPLHLVLVHHTTTLAKNLKDKWLHDPATVIARSADGPTAGPGDLLKAIEVASAARSESPELKVTLALTTNQEPDPTLITTITQAARAHGIDVDIWSRSRLSHELDFRAAGQWIRSQILGIDQDLLSAELLRELSKKSLESNCPRDDIRAWIPRALESTLADVRPNVTFLLGSSGLGKSVACWRLLQRHVDLGRCGLVISDDISQPHRPWNMHSSLPSSGFTQPSPPTAHRLSRSPLRTNRFYWSSRTSTASGERAHWRRSSPGGANRRLQTPLRPHRHGV